MEILEKKNDDSFKFFSLFILSVPFTYTETRITRQWTRRHLTNELHNNVIGEKCQEFQCKKWPINDVAHSFVDFSGFYRTCSEFEGF